MLQSFRLASKKVQLHGLRLKTAAGPAAVDNKASALADADVFQEERIHG